MWVSLFKWNKPSVLTFWVSALELYRRTRTKTITIFMNLIDQDRQWSLPRTLTWIFTITDKYCTFQIADKIPIKIHKHWPKLCQWKEKVDPRIEKVDSCLTKDITQQKEKFHHFASKVHGFFCTFVLLCTLAEKIYLYNLLKIFEKVISESC